MRIEENNLKKIMKNITKYIPVLNKTDKKDTNKLTPLLYAVCECRIEIVSYLLSNNADVSVTIGGGSNVYHIAAYKGYLQILQALIVHNNDYVNDVDKENLTPLYHAVCAGHIKIVNYLLKNKADVTVKNDQGWNVYHQAANKGYLQILQALIMHNNDYVNDVDKKNWTPLYHAVSKGHIEIVKHMLKNKSNVTVKNYQGWNVYHEAAYNGNLKIMMALIESNCDLLNEMNEAKEIPLRIASK